MKKSVSFRKIYLLASALVLVLCFVTTGCEKAQNKYNSQYLEYFDTFSTFEAVCSSKEEFDAYEKIVDSELKRYHRLFDIYNTYDGVANIKTINENAGTSPVETDAELVELIEDCREYYTRTNGAFNIGMGSVLRLWHIEREAAENEKEARLPDMQELKEAAEHISMDGIVTDRQRNTVFIADKNQSIDMGAIAKGYAAQKIIERLKAAGCRSAILNLGGNVCTVGMPVDKEKWKIGVESVDDNEEIEMADVIAVGETAVVSSGNYQRYYIVDGKRYHHIINSKTLFPADTFKAVTVVYSDSAVADMLSTSLFVMPYEEGRAFARYVGADAVWFFSDGRVEMTDGYEMLH